MGKAERTLERRGRKPTADKLSAVEAEKRTGKLVITSKNAIDFSQLISNLIEDSSDKEKNFLSQDVFMKLEAAEQDIAEDKTKDAKESLYALKQKHGL